MHTCTHRGALSATPWNIAFHISLARACSVSSRPVLPAGIRQQLRVRVQQSCMALPSWTTTYRMGSPTSRASSSWPGARVCHACTAPRLIRVRVTRACNLRNRPRIGNAYGVKVLLGAESRTCLSQSTRYASGCELMVPL